MKHLWNPLRVSMFMLAVNILTVNGVCQKREIFGELSIPGHHSLPVRYNVCVDSTTISPEPSMTRTGVAVFARDCCGCRVSSVTERESLEMTQRRAARRILKDFSPKTSAYDLVAKLHLEPLQQCGTIDKLRLQTIAPPSVTRSIYVPEIRACECIPCDATIYNWADYFTLLDHKRRK